MLFTTTSVLFTTTSVFVGLELSFSCVERIGSSETCIWLHVAELQLSCSWLSHIGLRQI